jgi:hypothetical protein
MSTPESIAKSKASNRAIIDAITEEERKEIYGRERTDEDKKKQADSISGRTYIYKDGKTKIVKPDDTNTWLSNGWILKTDLYKVQLELVYNGATAASVCKDIDISKASFSNMFKKVYGISISEHTKNKSA